MREDHLQDGITKISERDSFDEDPEDADPDSEDIKNDDESLDSKTTTKKDG
jgi:hypothetical protein